MLDDPGPSVARPRVLLAQLRQVLAAATVYDLVLAAIPLALVAGALAGTSEFVSLTTGVGAGGFGGSLAVGYAVFLNPPLGG